MGLIFEYRTHSSRSINRYWRPFWQTCTFTSVAPVGYQSRWRIAWYMQMVCNEKERTFRSPQTNWVNWMFYSCLQQWKKKDKDVFFPSYCFATFSLLENTSVLLPRLLTFPHNREKTKYFFILKVLYIVACSERRALATRIEFRAKRISGPVPLLLEFAELVVGWQLEGEWWKSYKKSDCCHLQRCLPDARWCTEEKFEKQCFTGRVSLNKLLLGLETYLEKKFTRREFLREILYKNMATIAIQHGKFIFLTPLAIFPILLGEIHLNPSGKFPYTYSLKTAVQCIYFFRVC